MKKTPQSAPHPAADLAEAAAPGLRETDEKCEAPGVIPPHSVNMMSDLLADIISEAYGFEKRSLVIQTVMFDDETFGLQLLSRDGHADSDIHEDPDFSAAVQAMLSDLKAEADPAALYVDPDLGYVEALYKMDLFEAIRGLARENGLDSVDTIRFQSPADEHGTSHQRINEMSLLNARLARGILGEEKARAVLFNGAVAAPSQSLEHYHASLMRPYKAKLSISLDHVYKAILQEDGLDAKDPRADLLKFGGFN